MMVDYDVARKAHEWLTQQIPGIDDFLTVLDPGDEILARLSSGEKVKVAFVQDLWRHTRFVQELGTLDRFDQLKVIVCLINYFQLEDLFPFTLDPENDDQ